MTLESQYYSPRSTAHVRRLRAEGECYFVPELSCLELNSLLSSTAIRGRHGPRAFASRSESEVIKYRGCRPKEAMPPSSAGSGRYVRARRIVDRGLCGKLRSQTCWCAEYSVVALGEVMFPRTDQRFAFFLPSVP